MPGEVEGPDPEPGLDHLISSSRQPRPRRVVGRRALFFWVAAFVCIAMVPAAPSDFRWVCWVTAGLGMFWAVLLSAEDLLRPRGVLHDHLLPAQPETPFPPPLPPGGKRR